MSGHTKGKAERLNESITVKGIVVARIAKTGNTEEETANAERFIKGWNCHDDLLAANKILIQQRDDTQQQRNDLLAALQDIIDE